MTSSMTALEIRAEEYHKNTAKFNTDKLQWTVRLPWIKEDVEAHRMTDNLRRVIAMLHKVHKTVKQDDLPMVDEAYMTMISQGFAEEIPPTELEPSWPCYYLVEGFGGNENTTRNMVHFQF